MKKERIKEIFTDAASDVADQFYPKGHERRGEFIRDSAVLYTKISDNLDRYVKEKKRKPIALHVAMITNDILNHFVEVKHGAYSDDAYFELIEFTELMLLGEMKKKDYVEHLEFIFGFNGSKEVATVRQMSEKKYKYYQEHGHLDHEEEECLRLQLDQVIPKDLKKKNF